MPPLRPSRHLRPCHFYGSAQQAYTLIQPVRAKYSTDSHSSAYSFISLDVRHRPVQNALQGRYEEQDGLKSWWTVVKDGIASFGLKTADAELTPLQDKSSKAVVARQSANREWQIQILPKSETQGFYTKELDAIKYQLQQLSEQVKVLQNTLKNHSPSAETSIKSVTTPNVITPVFPAFQAARAQPTVAQNSQPKKQSTSNRPPKMPIDFLKPMPRKTPLSSALFLDFASAEYRNSIFVLIDVFEELEELAPRLVANISILLARHLHSVTEDDVVLKDRMIFNDSKLKKKFKRYRSAKKWYARAVYESPSKTNSQDRGAPMFSLYVLGRARKRHMRAFYVLTSIGNALEAMRPEAVFKIKSSLIQYMHNVVQNAVTEGDQVMLSALNRYSGIRTYLKAEQDSVLTSSYAFKPTATSAVSDGGSTGQNENNVKDSKTQVKEKKMVAQEKSVGNETPQKPSHPHSSSRHSSRSVNGSQQSLLQELFPETHAIPQARAIEAKGTYPKLDLPVSERMTRGQSLDRPQTLREQVVGSIQKKEQIAVLQLSHCSTKLVEADFRRFIPKGRHINTWGRDGEFYKVIPGRDIFSLERLPFYYILFKNPGSALAYQKNVSRLHKLSALHQPTNIFSAIPPPKGFLEDGEDLNTVTSTYNLLPTYHQISLNVVMQPYSPALLALFDQGGYAPIVSDEKEGRIWKVLMHIEGYEPTPSDLFRILRRDAFVLGLPVLTLRNESSRSIHRLRDLVDWKSVRESPPPMISSVLDGSAAFADSTPQADVVSAHEDQFASEMNQLVMNRVYNRWIIDFADENAAIRFARRWHRRVLPEVRGREKWKEQEEERMCNVEVLW